MKHEIALPRRARGCTLIEALVAATIAAVLAAIALPSLAHVLERQKLAVGVDQFLLAVDLARSTARAAQMRVGLEPLAGGRWESGWRVFADRNGDGTLDEGEQVLREFPGAGGVAISAHFGNYRADVLSFDAVGNVRRPGSAGFVLGRVVFRQAGTARAVCFSALQVRTVAAAECQ